MTGNFEQFGAGVSALQKKAHGAAFRNGMTAVNLAEVFAQRGVFVRGGDDGNIM